MQLEKIEVIWLLLGTRSYRFTENELLHSKDNTQNKIIIVAFSLSLKSQGTEGCQIIVFIPSPSLKF